MQIQILRRSCDSPKCDRTIDLKVGNLRPTDEMELSNWIVLTKEHVLETGQQPQPMTKMACSESCAIEVLRNHMLNLPKAKAAN